jgi:hypothetical protein
MSTNLEITPMPKMSDHYLAFIAPMIEAEDDLERWFALLPSEIYDLQESWTEAGLVRGLHYTVTPITQKAVDEIRSEDELSFPCRVSLCDIKFRNRRNFDVAREALPDTAGPSDLS